MRAILLGTGTSQGVPVIGCNCNVCNSLDFRDKRLRTSLYLETGYNKLVIDTGPDFRQQMLTNYLNDVDALLFTHQHRDHIAGLDDIRPVNFIQDKDMPIYGEQHVLDQLKTEFYYAFEQKPYPGVPRLTLNQITTEPFPVGNDNFIPIRAFHHKLPILGFRTGNFSYLTDANYLETSEKEKMRGSEVIILNALRKEEHLSHFTLDEALALIDDLQPKKAYLVHISHDMGLHADVERELPSNVSLGYDGLQINL